MRNLIAILILVQITIGKIEGQGIDISSLDLECDTSFLGALQGRQYLFLEAYIPECGEFGGHKELIRLKRNKDNKIEATIIIFETICYGYSDSIKIKNQDVKVLSDHKIQLVKKYLIRHLMQCLQENQVTHGSFIYKSYFAFENQQIRLPGQLNIVSWDLGNWCNFMNLKEGLIK